MIAGRKHSASGNRIFTGTLAAFSRAPLTSLVAHLVRLSLQDPANRQAERVGLRENDRKRDQVVNVGPQLQVVQGVMTREPKLHLSERQAQLIADRRFETRTRDLHGLLQAESRCH